MLDRFLPVWIGAAMAAGLLLGRLVPGLNGALNQVAIHGTSLPIALGLLLMMYPVLAKVRYNQIGQITADRRMMTTSLVLNWVVGPAVMFALAWLLLPDQPAYRTGVILVGLARCIAMVLIWTDLASGDREMATVLVALNAVFQVLLYAALGFFYLQVLPGWLGLATTSLHVSIAEIAATVAVFLGIPLAAGYLTRTLGERARGRDWYETRFLPKIAPVALYGLLFTVMILFALQGKKITSQPLDVARIALPLLAYFAIMWGGAFAISRRLHLTYPRTAALSFSAASNDFELAIAVAIGVFGVTSGQALAGVVGPLIEVPVMVALVYLSLWARRYYPAAQEAAAWVSRLRLVEVLGCGRRPRWAPCCLSASPTRVMPNDPKGCQPAGPGQQPRHGARSASECCSGTVVWHAPVPASPGTVNPDRGQALTDPGPLSAPQRVRSWFDARRDLISAHCARVRRGDLDDLADDPGLVAHCGASSRAAGDAPVRHRAPLPVHPLAA
jgi:ACR3 family arsenite transporter